MDNFTANNEIRILLSAIKQNLLTRNDQNQDRMNANQDLYELLHVEWPIRLCCGREAIIYACVTN